MAEQRETRVASAERAVRPDDERTVSELEPEPGLETELPLDAPFEAPIEDLLDQRHVEVIDDESYDAI